VLVGIQRGGVHIAHRLSARIDMIEHVSVPVGSLDISLYRDDISRRKKLPIVRKTDIPSIFSEKVIVLVDDVLFHR